MEIFARWTRDAPRVDDCGRAIATDSAIVKVAIANFRMRGRREDIRYVPM